MELKINYRVLGCDKENHSMLVRYWTDNITEEDLANRFDEYGKIIYSIEGYPSQTRTDVNISFFSNPNPSEQDIKKMIESGAPTFWLHNLEQIKSGNTAYCLANVESIVGATGSFNTSFMPNLEAYLDNLMSSANT